MEKTFAGVVSQTVKFVKVFSLKKVSCYMVFHMYNLESPFNKQQATDFRPMGNHYRQYVYAC